MAEAYYGKWESTVLDKFDEYMKALGVSFFLRKAGAHATTTINISPLDGGLRWQYKIAFKNGDMQFKFGEEFDEVTPDERAVKTVVTVEGDKLVWAQSGKPHNSTLTRHIEEDGKTMVEVCTIEGKDVVCTRKYKRIS